MNSFSQANTAMSLNDIANTNRLYPSKCVADMLAQQSKFIPDNLALIFGSVQLSYKELQDSSELLAHKLLAMDLPRQSCIAYLGKECEKYYQLLFACAIAGYVLVPINWRLKTAEVQHILLDSGTRLVFASNEQQDIIHELQNLLSSAPEIIWLEADTTASLFNSENTEVAPLTKILSSADDILVQMYTSGTTGMPKGVRLPHRAFFQVRESLITSGLSWLDWQRGDICLIGIPGFHIGGLWWSLQGFSAGITNVSLPYFSTSGAIEAIVQHKVTQMCVVPAMLNMLLADYRETPFDTSELRKVVYGGSPISESLLDKGIKVLGCEFAQIYGLTETGNTAVCLDPASHLDDKVSLRAAGRPYPCVSLKIIDSDGQSLSNYEVGEVCIKTPAHMESYWRLPEATDKTLQDGWIHTGDAGYLNDDGYLFISDRIKDVIIVAGENIYPAEIENVISQHPAIHDCAVIGIPDEDWGEAAAAFLVLKPEQELDQFSLYQFLKPLLADFKIPKNFYFIEDLPRNPSGKILRRALREVFWEGRSRNV